MGRGIINTLVQILIIYFVCFLPKQAHLLCCLVQCFLKSGDLQSSQSEGEEDDEDNHAEVDEMLESFTRRMIKCELEDFELVSDVLCFSNLWFLNSTVFLP